MNRQNLQKPAMSESSDSKERAYYCRVSYRQKVCKNGKSAPTGAARPPFAGCAGILQAHRSGKRWRSVLLGAGSAEQPCDPFAGCEGLYLSGQTAQASMQAVMIQPGVSR